MHVWTWFPFWNLSFLPKEVGKLVLPSFPLKHFIYIFLGGGIFLYLYIYIYIYFFLYNLCSLFWTLLHKLSILSKNLSWCAFVCNFLWMLYLKLISGLLFIRCHLRDRFLLTKPGYHLCCARSVILPGPDRFYWFLQIYSVHPSSLCCALCPGKLGAGVQT